MTLDPERKEFRLYGPHGELLAHGTTPADAFAPLPDSAIRADAEQLLKDAAEALGLLEQQQDHEQQLQDQAAALRQHQLHALADGLAAMSRRLDAIEAHRAERRARAAADEARAIQAHLDSLPDPDDPASYGPSGDLHDLPPSNLQDKEALAAAHDQGALPNELRKGAPPEFGTDPVFNPAELAHPPVPAERTPAAIEE